MSYSEPRGGHPSTGRGAQAPRPGAAGTSAPPNGARPQAAQRSQPEPGWDPEQTAITYHDPAPGNAPAERPNGGTPAYTVGNPGTDVNAYPSKEPEEPTWAAPTAATSTSEAEWELTAAEAEAEAGRRGPGKRRAGRDGKPKPVRQNGRAGRNLPAAIGVGVGLVLLVLGSLFYLPAFVLVIAVAVSVGSWEMVRALKNVGTNPPLLPLLGGGLLMAGLAWYDGPDALQLGLVATLLASVVWRLSEHKTGFRRDIGAAALIAVYVPFLLSFGILLAKPDDGMARVLCVLLAVVLSDTGGYAAGVFFGKHPMAPSISPKKSWEGFAGSVVAAGAGGSLLLYFLLEVPFYWGALFGAVISVAAVIGDLAESMLKRDIKIKDMSNLLPGHGGLMDRLDSILFAVPAAYLLLSLIAPPG